MQVRSESGGCLMDFSSSRPRPTDVRCHVRRVVGALEAFAYATVFAALLWPFQFGIALASGMHFLVHAFHALLDKYLPPPMASCSTWIRQRY